MPFRSTLLLVLAAAVQANTSVDPGFTSLFNGTDLTGWKIAGAPESFAISDGAIVASGPASHAYYDGSFRNHRFRNFELRTDVLVRAGGNGGIYVLTEFEEVGGNERASGRFPSKGFEVQAYNGTAGPRTGSLYHVVDLDEPLVKDGEWFTETIVVQNDTIVVKVNGKQVVNWTQPADWNGGREGPGRRITGPGTIALQAHDPNSAVLYKNIRIKPLD
jgi:3-keto-disaccharide hydrolase